MKYLKLNLNKLLKLTILVSFLCLIFVGKVDAIVSATEDFYVNDYANVLYDDVKIIVMNNSVNLYEKKGVQIVVLTVNSLEGMSIEEYANTYYNENKIGSEENDGILILLAIEDRKVRVEIGDHLEGLLPDGRVGRIIDETAIDHFKRDEWSLGIKSLYNELLKIVLNNEFETVHNTQNKIGLSWNQLVTFGGIIASIILAIIFKPLGKVTHILFVLLNVGQYVFLKSVDELIWEDYIGMIFANFYFYIVIKSLLYSSSRGRRSGSSSHRGYTSHSRSFSGGSSSRSHSGGGGHSSGGGASRGF